jgi:hypothetical protein
MFAVILTLDLVNAATLIRAKQIIFLSKWIGQNSPPSAGEF